MCKYMILKNGISMCKNGQMCTLCVIGNSKTYKELESNEENNNETIITNIEDIIKKANEEMEENEC